MNTIENSEMLNKPGVRVKESESIAIKSETGHQGSVKNPIWNPEIHHPRYYQKLVEIESNRSYRSSSHNR